MSTETVSRLNPEVVDIAEILAERYPEDAQVKSLLGVKNHFDPPSRYSANIRRGGVSTLNTGMVNLFIDEEHLASAAEGDFSFMGEVVGAGSAILVKGVGLISLNGAQAAEALKAAM